MTRESHPNRSAGVCRTDQHDDVGEDAPAGHVIDRGTRNCHCAQPASQHVLSDRMRAKTGKAVMLMADPMNSAKLVKATLSSDRRG